MKKFYLIDGHAQIFRAYYAPFGDLTSPSGEPVKATQIFTQMLLAIVRDKKPDYLAVAFDVSDSTTLRRDLYPEYKATREESPEDLHPQVERIVEIVQLLGIPIFSLTGYEADDVIATIAHRLTNDDVELCIVSRDKDLYQLLSDKVKLWDPTKDEVIDSTAVEAKHGFTPEQAVDVQTLTGDSTDNIPGIHGVGVKKAVMLLKKYGNADNVVAHADELTPKLRENVLAYKDQIDCTRQLVTLSKDTPIDFDLAACTRGPLALKKVRPLFEDLGFRRLLSQLDDYEQRMSKNDSSSPAAKEDTTGETSLTRTQEGHYKLISDSESFATFCDELRQQTLFAIDTETTSLDAVDCKLVGISLSWKAGEGTYVALRSRLSPTLDSEETLKALKPILEDAGIAKCGQNLKYDIQVLRAAGIELRGVHFDTMIASYLLQPDRRRHGMDGLAADLLGHKTIPISELIGSGKNQISLTDVPLESLADYAGEDADITWRLYETLKPQIDDSPMKSLFYDVEMPLMEVLADMEFTGVCINVNLLQSIGRDLDQRLAQLKNDIYSAAGRQFVIDSPKQLGEVLFDDLGLRVVKKTKTSRSTDAFVLRTLAVESAHPLPELVLEYRELAKLRGTYVDPLPQLVSSRTRRLHTSFHQAVTATGRLSSSDPNIQNIPIRTAQGREIRRAFVAQDSDHALIMADYSQIELRVLAHFSKDEELLKAFREDQDIHAFVAAQVNDIPIEEVSKEQRNKAKAINFGIIYGQGAFGLANSLGISRQEAADFINAYKERYHGITTFMEDCVREAEETERVSTMLGRQRPIPEIHSRNRMRRALGERLAINTVVQGTAADIIKVAMVRLHEKIAVDKLPIRMLVQVHDELVLESPHAFTPEYAKVVQDVMQNAVKLDVPLRVDVGWGDNWLDTK